MHPSRCEQPARRFGAKDKIMSKPDSMSPASHKDIVRQIVAGTGRIIIKGGKPFFVSDL